MDVPAPRDRLVFALDVEDEARARDLVTQLRSQVGLFKLGLELLSRGGMALVERVLGDAPVMVDAKLHDVPATVARAVRQFVRSSTPVRFLTVHNCVSEAARAAGSRAGILLVTVLTSVDPAELGGPEALSALARRRARDARDQGAAGVVCAVSEARAIRDELGPDFVVLTPGIRPSWAAVPADDQRRTATVAAALRAGASHLVVGRPIRDAADPAQAAQRIVDEIAAG